MKKTLLTLFTVALAANIQAAEPTLLPVFEHTTDMPASGDARFGTGFGGKVFTVDKANKQVIAWDENGKSVYAQNDLFTGTAITRDDSGNILVSSGFPNAASSTNWTIISATDNSKTSLTLSIPEEVGAGRFDQAGRIVGNVLSNEGGYLYITINTKTKAVVTKIVNGSQDIEKTYVSSTTPAFTTSHVAQPSLSTVAEIEAAENPGNTFYWRNRTDQKVCYFDENNTIMNFTTPVATNGLKARSCEGFDVFTMGETTYVIHPFDDVDYGPGFAICTTDGQIIATRTSEFNPGGQRFQSIVAEKVSDNTYNIYQYVSGSVAAMFVFTTDSDIITGVEDTMVDANAPVEYYNLQGVKVENPSNGLFIKRQGAKATKVVL